MAPVALVVRQIRFPFPQTPPVEAVTTTRAAEDNFKPHSYGLKCVGEFSQKGL